MTSAGHHHSPPLGAHRLLGHGVGAALVLPDGEVDWWCPDRFHAPPLLWSLLDPAGGRSRWRGAAPATWNECPAGPTSRTTVRIGDTRVELWDGLVGVDGGSVLVRLARPYGRSGTLVHELRLGGFDAPPGLPAHMAIVGHVTIASEDDHLAVTVPTELGCWTGFAISTVGVIDVDLPELLAQAERAEQRHLDRLRLPHHHPSRAVDALRVMRALTDPTSGAPVASPTTSLPEAPGGGRQFDYRYSWLRDSALAVGTASLLGHLRAARRYLAFVSDLLDRVGRHLQPLTTSDGGRVPVEREVPGITGWADSRPVRVGNEATQQRQLDAVAAVIEAAWTYAVNGGRVDRRTWELVDRLATLLAETPPGPSSGVWERRTPALLVSEELARWRGLDRALRLRRRCRPWRRRRGWSAARREARDRVERALDPVTGRLHSTLDGDAAPDAASLLAVTSGFWSRRDPRSARLVAATIDALEEGPFLRRYPPIDDGFAGIEGAFVPSSWWAVTALATLGDVGAASQRADELCARLPPLMPEQWDVVANRALGNTPLLWSHTEAANALFTLHRARIRRRVGPVGVAAWSTARAIRRRLLTTPARRHGPPTV